MLGGSEAKDSFFQTHSTTANVMARRTAPMGREYGYSPRAAGFVHRGRRRAEEPEEASSSLELRRSALAARHAEVAARHAEEANAGCSSSLERRMTALEARVSELVCIVGANLGRPDGGDESRALTASASVALEQPMQHTAMAPPLAPPMQYAAMAPPQFMMAPQSVMAMGPQSVAMATQPVMMMGAQPFMMGGDHHGPCYWLPGWAPPAWAIQHAAGDVRMAWAQPAAPPACRRAGPSKPSRVKRGAPMPAPPWEYNTLRASSELPGPGQYYPKARPETSSFNIRITPDPENPGYGSYTGKPEKPKAKAEAK